MCCGGWGNRKCAKLIDVCPECDGGVMLRKAVYTENNWPEVHNGDILVTFVRQDESDSDAILRAIEIFGHNSEYYVANVYVAP